MDFKKKILLFGVAPWAVAVLVLIFLVLPGLGFTASKSASLQEKETELANLKQSVANAKNLTKIKKEKKNLQKTLTGFNIMYPKKEDLETLYADLQTSMSHSSSMIALLKLSVSKPKKLKLPKKFFDIEEEKEDKKALKGKKKKKKKKRKKRRRKKGKKEQPLELTRRSFKLELATYNFQSVIDFLYYLDNYYRFVTLEGVQVKEGAAKQGKVPSLLPIEPNKLLLQIAIVFSVYTVKENHQEPEQKKKKKKKK